MLVAAVDADDWVLIIGCTIVLIVLQVLQFLKLNILHFEIMTLKADIRLIEKTMVKAAIAPAPVREETKRSGYVEGGNSGSNAISLIAVALVLITCLVQLFVLLPAQREIAQRQATIEATLADTAWHEATMKEAQKREAINAAKLLVHQELALRLFKKGDRP